MENISQPLLKIAQSEETDGNIIQLETEPTPSKVPQQIVELDSSTLEVAMNPGKFLDLAAPLENNLTNLQDEQQAFLNLNEQIILLTGAAGVNEVKTIDELQPILKFPAYNSFKDAMSNYENQTITKFILRNQSKQFHLQVCLHDILGNEKGSDLPLIRWEFCGAKDFLPIPFMGVPYISVGKQVFQCHQGKDYNMNKKRQYELAKEILNQASRSKIKTRDKGPTKKLDCPVLLVVRKLYIFPEYPIQKDTKKNRQTIAQKIRKELLQIKKQKCDCKFTNSIGELVLSQTTGKPPPGKLEFLTRFPMTSLHNHDITKAANAIKLQSKRQSFKRIFSEKTLKKSAEANPYQYDKHIELITALRASGDLDQLRSARENMAAVYPLAEELWLEWFEDELPLAIIAEHKEFLISKFELAVKDYASTKIWQEYCQFLMNNIESPSDIDRARETFERAITAVGLHVTEGSCIWDGYREFEMAILDSYQQLQDSGDTVGMDEKVRMQIEKIASLFKRQLSIPLIGITDVFAAFENWSSEAIPDETQRGYEKASQKLNSFLEYEEKLQSSQTTGKLLEYYEYINFEIKDGDPARIQSLYERAIKDNCLQHELWENYTQYLDSKLKIHSIALSVHERAVRNCPWISKLWQNYLKSMERNNKEYEKVKDVFEQSLKGGFADSKSYLDIWLLNMDYHRRRVTNWHAEDEKVIELHKVFEDAVTYMNRSFGLEGDKYCVLLREMALIEAKYLHNVNRAQELWDTVMKKHSRDTNMWLEYISLLMLYSDEAAIRRVFQRAVQISFEQPEFICDAFIKYERQYGNLETLDDAQIKVDVQLQKARGRRAKDSDRQNQNETTEKRHEKKGKDKYKFLPDDKKRKKQRHGKQNHRHDIKRAADLDGFKEPLPSKKPRVNNQTQENLPESDDRPGSGGTVEIPVAIVSSSTMEDELQKKTNLEIPRRTNGESTDKTPSITAEPVPMSVASTLRDIEMEVTESSDEGKGKIENEATKPDTVDNERSVFLSNMLFTVEESHIRDLFQKCGEISTVRIVLNRAGKSKGFAYLEFKDKASIEEALALDRESLLGRPVFVSRCVDKKENPTKFKFPTTLDKRTLYVTNIPFEITTEELTKIFVECGNLKQVRIVTNRSGKSKGFAYVEYENESDAASAVVKVDKHVINNRPINVALSNPPARKVKVADGSADTGKSRPQEQPGSRGRSKTQISLLPRTLQKSTLQSTAKPSEPVLVNNKPSCGSEKSDTTASNTEEKSTMSNSDFRKFLLK